MEFREIHQNSKNSTIPHNSTEFWAYGIYGIEKKHMEFRIGGIPKHPNKEQMYIYKVEPSFWDN
jgi:hypothetical protein